MKESTYIVHWNSVSCGDPTDRPHAQGHKGTWNRPEVRCTEKKLWLPQATLALTYLA